MNEPVRIFLGANSGEGFYSLYGQLLDARFDDLLLIKGGPGCGKSSFMRTVAKKLTEITKDIIYVNCSGDPDSLDAALFPALRAGVVDATAPHVLEPTYAVANERYLDLTRFYDVEATKAARAEIAAHTDAYRAAYAQAYHVLRAADALSSERRAVLRAAADMQKLMRRVERIARHELRGGKGTRGRTDEAFLGGMTHQGELCRFETVDALCPRVYELADSCGLAAGALAMLRDTAAEAGFDTLACRDPDHPQELRHLLIPEPGLAFVTSDARTPYPGKPYRRLLVDAIAELPRAEKARLRLSGRIENALRGEALTALRRAKEEHDALEAVYNPCVDFSGVYALAEAEAERLAKRFAR